jgi:TolB-like protein
MGIRRMILPELLLLLLAGTAAFSQGPPLIAVLPLQALGGLNAEQVGTVTRLLETGLVKSSRFQVLERNEIAQVLAAQEFSAKDCFDENCAVRLGRLLAARLIVLGTLSRLGDKFFLTAKIIEVATGKTLEAEHEEADTLEAIARRAENLGFRLAGRQPEAQGTGIAGMPAAQARPIPDLPVPRKQRLQEEQRKLEGTLAQEIRRARSLRTGSRVLYGIAAGLALASGATLIVGLSQPEQASAVPWFGFSLSFAVLGSTGAVVGTAVWLEQPDLENLQDRIAELENQIREEEKK